uniref:CCHC-type domain-containing protein n=1 Tax=Oryza nivara TaxID=4536 RepID=A0A0E0J2C7_ORYNI
MVAEAALPPLPPSLPHRSGRREGGPRPQRRRRVFSTLRLATPRAAVAPSAISLLPPASAVAAAVALAAAADGWCRRRPRMDDVAATADGWRGDDRGRRWQRPRAAVAMANGGSGGRREKFCDDTVLEIFHFRDRCLNCGETNHLSEGCPMPPTLQVVAASAQRGQIQIRHNGKAKDPNRHLNVQPPPQRIIVKGTTTGHIVPQLLQTYSTSTSRVSNARKKTTHYNYKETVHSFNSTRNNYLQHQVTRLLPTLGMHLALLQSGNPAPGDTLSKKILLATAVKRVVILPSKINTQSNVSGETPASRN